jgi:hypothetical protein
MPSLADAGRSETTPTQRLCSAILTRCESASATDYLRLVTAPTHHAYKDVVQPFVTTRWLASSSLRVLRIPCPVPHVAASMLGRGWTYSRYAARATSEPIQTLLEGLLRAEAAHRALGAVTVHYDELVSSEQPLLDALRTLYPEVPVSPPLYLDAAFEAKRDATLALRQTDGYRRLVDDTALVRDQLDQADATVSRQEGFE